MISVYVPLSANFAPEKTFDASEINKEASNTLCRNKAFKRASTDVHNDEPDTRVVIRHHEDENMPKTENYEEPDTKVVINMLVAVSLTMYPISYLFTKFHYINTYSHRLELYAVKNGGYKKFREKAFKTHKTHGNWLGAYS